MKKLIILIVIVAVVGGLWYWGSTRASLLEDPGKLAGRLIVCAAHGTPP